MARQVLAWQCKFCGTIKKTEAVCLRHEKACTDNPDAKNCMFCKYSYKDTDDNVLKCNKRKIQCTRAVSANCEYFKRKD